ncbi:hypothetical protein B0H13DRAFT_1885450 [Mycena leptocephala]|nr:hypothetical protein B0H13DRAFT_1885450 [Mycena leptocephala]
MKRNDRGKQAKRNGQSVVPYCIDNVQNLVALSEKATQQQPLMLKSLKKQAVETTIVDVFREKELHGDTAGDSGKARTMPVQMVTHEKKCQSGIALIADIKLYTVLFLDRGCSYEIYERYGEFRSASGYKYFAINGLGGHEFMIEASNNLGAAKIGANAAPRKL